MNAKQKAAMLYDCADALVSDYPPFSERQREAVHVRNAIGSMSPKVCAELYDRIVEGRNV